MPNSVRLAFSGQLSLDETALGEFDYQIVDILRTEAEVVAREIADRLTESVGITPTVTIHFSQGSVEWSGLVEWVHGGWPWIEVMSTIGGAIGLIQIVKGAIDAILRRWLRRAIGQRPISLHPHTRVILVAFPRPSIIRSVAYGLRSDAVGLAALVASVSMLLAAIALLIWVLQR